MKRLLLAILITGCGTEPNPCAGFADESDLVHLGGAVKVLQMNGVDRYEAHAYCSAVAHVDTLAGSECCEWIMVQFYGE